MERTERTPVITIPLALLFDIEFALGNAKAFAREIINSDMFEKMPDPEAILYLDSENGAIRSQVQALLGNEKDPRHT